MSRRKIDFVVRTVWHELVGIDQAEKDLENEELRRMLAVARGEEPE